MTQTEIKAKIADWESRLKNPSVASVPSAVAKINSIIDDLKSKLEKDESIVTDKATIQKIKNSINEGELILKSGKIHGRKMSESELDGVLDSINKERAKIGMPKFEKPKEKAPKKEKKAKAEKGIKPKFKIGDLVDVVWGEENGKSGEITKVYSYELYPKSMKSDSIPEYEIEGMSKDISESNLELSKKEAKADKKEFEPKFKVGDYVSMFKDEPNLEVVKVYEFSDKKATYDLKSKDGKINRGNISETKLTKAEEKSEPKESKKSDYDCDDLIKEAKERHAKAKKAAEARAEAPKKTEATKDKEKIEKVYDNVEKHIEKNKLSKAQLEKLIAETKDLLKLLEKALKNL